MSTKFSKESIFVPKQSLLFMNDENDSKCSSNKDLVYQVKEDRLAVIEASAGTGKTFALVELVLELMLEKEIPLKKILLVTFTEKAKSELKTRLRIKLQNLLEIFDQKAGNQIKTPPAPFWEINTKKINLLRAALIDFESAQVYTIHGFCKKILSEFAFENRQLFKQDFCDTNILFDELFGRYIRRNFLSQKTPVSKLFSIYVKQNEGNIQRLREEILKLLNKEGHILPNLPSFGGFIKNFTVFWENLISKDLILRSKNAVKHPIIMAFENTSLNKASRGKTFENLNLLLKILGEYQDGASILEVFPSFVEVMISSITNPKCNKNLNPGDKWLSVKRFPKPERLWIEALEECELLIKKNNIFGGAKKVFKVWLIQNVLEEISNEITKTKLERGIFDFDDLLRIVEEEICSNHKNKSVTSPLAIAVREKYLCAIIDEFQDTDKRQWSIFSNIFLESSQHSLIVIGDPKQSIYSFRGADIFTYLKAKQKILEKQSSLPFILKKNFRSTEEMIFGLNQIFKRDVWFPENQGIIYHDVFCGNPKLEFQDKSSDKQSIHLLKLFPKFLISSKKIENHKKMKNPKVPLNILLELETLIGERFLGEETFCKKLNSVLGEEEFSKNSTHLLDLFLDDQTKNATIRFADMIALEIKNLLQIGRSEKLRPVWKEEGLERHIIENDICILFRKTSEGQIISKSLKKFGINFVFHKQKGLFSGREAIEILDLLQAIANPSDYSRVGKLLLTRFFEVNLKGINRVELINSKIFNQLQDWNSLALSRKFARLFDNILNITKLIERELFFGGDERSVTNYLHLFELLNKKIKERHLDLFELIRLLKGYIDGVEEDVENEDLLRIESERNAVQLMTMHAAKGLEFPVVFLFGGLSASKRDFAKFYYNSELEKEIIDLLNTDIPMEYKWQEQAEQRRLLYVAMTRARGRLYLPYLGLLSNDSKKQISKINGIYSILNQELINIISEDLSNKKKLPFSISSAKNSDDHQRIDFESQRMSVIKEWVPKELKMNSFFFNTKKDQEKIFEKLRFEKRGFVVSSFSKLKRKEKRRKSKFWGMKDFPSFEFINEEELSKFRENDEISFDFLNEVLESNLDLSLEKKEVEINEEYKKQTMDLSGGVKMGNLLHEILEKLDFFLVRKSDSLEEWIKKSRFQRYFESFNDRYGYPTSMLYPIAEIIWRTLRAKIKLGNSPESPVIELASITRDLREVDFYFPISKARKKAQELFYKNKSFIEGWNVEKGFLKGSIDYLFEHDGRIYLLDWKSNILDNYSQASLEKVVMEHYELQLKIYTLATCYWFKINCEQKYKERFGGAIYIFLRGIKNFSKNSALPLSQENSGVFFKRPTWNEFLNYEKKLFLMDI